MDDWGCVKEEDSFFSTGDRKSLDELVESLISKSESIDGEDFEHPRVFPISSGISRNVEIVSYDRDCPATGFAPKILKKKTGLFATNAQRPNLKRVTFEVEKFAADECGDSSERNTARARLALQLGAKPVKKPYLNYKALKAKIVSEKLVAKEDDKDAKLYALKSSTLRRKGKKAKKTRK